jgi:hypothetical protein
MKDRPDFYRIEIIDPAVAAILRRKTITERVAMILDANATMRQLIEAPLRARHSDWNNQQIRREVARRMTRETR